MSETISFSGGTFKLPSTPAKGSTPVTVSKTTVDGQQVFLVAPERTSRTTVRNLALAGETDGIPIFVNANVNRLITNFTGADDTLIIGRTTGSRSELNFGDGNDSFSTTSIQQRSSVNTGTGDDKVTIQRRMDKSNIDMGAGNDNLIVGQNVNQSQIFLGHGDDTASIQGRTTGSNIDMGDGNDKLIVGQNVNQSQISLGHGDDTASIQGRTTGSNIDMGVGNDNLIFGGNVTRTQISLGGGADKLTFNGNVRNSSIDLGSDTSQDTITFSNGANLRGVKITGAGEGDILFIGTTQYDYSASTNTWINPSDPSNSRQF